MNKHELVIDLVNTLGEKKSDFLVRTELSINAYIRSQGAGCMAIVEKQKDGSVYKIWKLAPSADYAQRLLAFCRRKDFNGRELDSGLTEGVVNLVIREFEDLYDTNSEEIARVFTVFLIKNEVLSRSMVTTLVDSQAIGFTSDKVKGQIISLILTNLSHLLHTTTAKTVLAATGQAIAAAAAKPIGTKIAMLITQHVAIYVKAIAMKILASGAVKNLIVLAVKKFIIVAIVGTVVKTIGIKLGISTGGVVVLILLPLLVWYIAHDIYTFPSHLGKKVSQKVVEELDDKFVEINREVFDVVVERFLDSGVDTLAAHLAKVGAIQVGLKELVEQVEILT